jgi:flagellar protein FliS
MSAASLRARYLGDAVATSSPQQVLVMLYDRLALDLERAQKAAASGASSSSTPRRS